MRSSGRPSWSASHSVEASSSGRGKAAQGRRRALVERCVSGLGQASPVSYGRGRPVHARCGEARGGAGGACRPPGPGIYLNTGSAGPIPLETAAAMDELSKLGAAHRPGPRPEYFEDIPRADGRGTGGRRSDPRRRRRRDRASPTHDRRHEHRDVGRSTGSAGDRAVTTTHEHPAASESLVAVRDRFGVELVFVDIGDGGTTSDARGVRRGDHARHDGWSSLSHVLWSTGARVPVERIAAIARGARRARCSRRGPGGRRDPGVGRRDRCRLLRRRRPEVAARAGGHGRAVGVTAGDRGGGGEPRRLVQLRRRSTSAATPSTIRPRGGSRPRTITGRRSPAFARSCGWLSMYVGLPWIHARGDGARPGAPPTASAGIPGVSCSRPRERMATLVTFRIAGWPARSPSAELGSRVFAIARTILPLDAIRISVGSSTRGGRSSGSPVAVELLAAHRPETMPPRSATDDPRRGGLMTADPRRPRIAAAGPPADPPPSCGRDPLAPVPQRAATGRPGGPQQPRRRDRAGGGLYLAYDVAISRGGGAAGRRSAGRLVVTVIVLVVLVAGSVVTYWSSPSRAARGRRGAADPWSAALGLVRGGPDLLPRPGRRRPGAQATARLIGRRVGRAPRGSLPPVGLCRRSPLPCHGNVRRMAHSYYSAVPSARYHHARSGIRPSAHLSRICVAIDEQHVALPKLYGAPAYARPPSPRRGGRRGRSIRTTCRSRPSRPPRNADLLAALPARSYAPGGSVGRSPPYRRRRGTWNRRSNPKPTSLRALAGRILGGDGD